MKEAEQPAPQTESGADALRKAARRAWEAYLCRFESKTTLGFVIGPIDEQMIALRAALAAAEPTNSKGPAA